MITLYECGILLQVNAYKHLLGIWDESPVLLSLRMVI